SVSQGDERTLAVAQHQLFLSALGPGEDCPNVETAPLPILVIRSDPRSRNGFDVLDAVKLRQAPLARQRRSAHDAALLRLAIVRRAAVRAASPRAGGEVVGGVRR